MDMYNHITPVLLLQSDMIEPYNTSPSCLLSQDRVDDSPALISSVPLSPYTPHTLSVTPHIASSWQATHNWVWRISVGPAGLFIRL